MLWKLISLLFLTSVAAFAVEEKPIAELSTSDAIILGVVEGVTEFLPVSSTGHLVVANHFLHLDSELPLKDATGNPILFRKPSPKHPAGVVLTQKLAADTYSIIIQFGAIAAVALLYWREILSILNGVIGRDPEGLRLFIRLMIAFLPSAVLGLLLSSWIDAHLFSILAVVIAQILGGFFMLFAEAWRKKNGSYSKEPRALTEKQAFGIGALQCLALWPGTSRSMTTIIGGYFSGLDPKHSAEFSFLLGLLTLTAATVYKSYQGGAAMIHVFGWPHVLLGCLVAAVSAALAVKLFVGYLTKKGLGLFAWWRFAFGGTLLVLMLMHLI